MFETLAAAISGEARARVRRVALVAGFAVAALVFLAIALAALAGALFFWLEIDFGPIEASLIVAGGSFVIAILASAPLWWPKYTPPPPPQPTLAEFIGLVAKQAPALTPKQMGLAAVFGTAALFLMRDRKPKPKR